jgi:hypothetical protein
MLAVSIVRRVVGPVAALRALRTNRWTWRFLSLHFLFTA